MRFVPLGSVSTTEALTASCPSRNTVARMGIASPTTALAGYAPPSITGDTLCTGIRSKIAPSDGLLMVTAGAPPGEVSGGSVEAGNADAVEPA
jgi:hypothetical protein